MNFYYDRTNLGWHKNGSILTESCGKIPDVESKSEEMNSEEEIAKNCNWLKQIGTRWQIWRTWSLELCKQRL